MTFSLLGGLAILIASQAHQPAENPSRHELLAPPGQIKMFSLGYNEFVADMLWIRVIQDFEACGKTQSKASPMIIGDAASAQFVQRVGRCDSSWVYRMIDAVTELAPNFREPYVIGGVMLSVSVDDVMGAGKIFEKAVAQFPTDWTVLYPAAYHFLFEMGDKDKAAKLLVEASKYGAPKWVALLAARLYSKTGRAELGKRVVEDLLERNPDLANNEHLKQRMAEIERDLHSQEQEPQPAASTPSKPKGP